jgi:hypothetical protein
MKFERWCLKALRLTLTRGQAVACAIAFDGMQPRQLSSGDQAIALELLGSLDDIPDDARDQVVLRMGRASGKSTIAAAASLKRMVEADLSQVGPGDIAAAIVIGQGRDGGEDTLNKARALARQSRFASCIRRDKGDCFHILRKDGREVRFQVIAASAKGKAGRGKSIIQVIIDESEFVASSDPSKIVRDIDIVNSVIPRMIQGAKLILASTPWPAESYTSDQFDTNWMRPTTAIAFKATSLVMRDYDPFIVEKVEKELKRDWSNAQREYLCNTGDVTDSWFEATTIDRALSYASAVTKVRAIAGIDLAFRSDSSAIVVTERQAKLAVVALETDVPEKGVPLRPAVIGAKYAKMARLAGCHEMVADGHYIESARESAEKEGLSVVEGPSITGDKEASFIYARDLFRDDLVSLMDDQRLIKQLKAVRVVHQSGGGVRIVLPKRAGEGHCDFVSALVNAMWHDRRKHGPLCLGSKAKEDVLPTWVPRKVGGMVGGSVFAR